MRALASALLLLVLVMGQPGPASAADGTTGLAEATKRDNGVDVSAGQSGSTDTTASNTVTVRLDGCTFLPSLAPSEVLDQLAGRALFPVEGISSDTQRYTMIICPADGERELFYEFWPEGGLPPERVTRFLGREALARAEVPIPQPQGAPDGVDIPYLVNLPNWWWLDDWSPATGTAALPAPNPVSVTAILTPTESIWAVEGYDSITCTQGKPWHRDRGLQDSDPQRCGMTFPRHAPPEGLEQTVTVTYEVSFTCAPAALCDQLPRFEPISVDTTTTVDIIQVRGVLLS